MKKLLEKLFDHQQLTKVEAKQLLTGITEGELNDFQIVAAISAIKMRAITPDELNGFRESILEKAIQVELDGTNAIDVCGTGGDGKNTFNISTLAAIVIAGAGYRVIKHGNYGVSSLVGSPTIIEKCGYQFSTDSQNLNQQLNQSNLCFLHAPLFHLALKRVAPIRQGLATSTFFNFLGPLVNPVQPEFQLTGVYNLQLMRIYKTILAKERTRFKVVHSMDGYDEVSLTGPFKISANNEDLILFPKDLGFENLQSEDLHGGDTVESSQEIFNGILDGNGTLEQNAVVLTNAALGIQCFNSDKSFREAFEEARSTLLSGKARLNFNQCIALSKISNTITQ